MSKKKSIKMNILPLMAIFVLAHTFNGPKEPEMATNSSLDQKIQESKEQRIKALESFFEEVNSPLKDQSDTFVEVADKYGLDYKLLPAISCIESSCGVKLIEDSYNPFGWGIYGNNAVYFESWEDAIETVGKGIKEKYVAKGFNTPEKIAPIYTPPNSTKWLYAVRGFMYKIENFRGLPRNLDSVSLVA